MFPALLFRQTFSVLSGTIKKLRNPIGSFDKKCCHFRYSQLRMGTVQTSVTLTVNRPFQDYPRLEDHITRLRKEFENKSECRRKFFRFRSLKNA